MHLCMVETSTLISICGWLFGPGVMRKEKSFIDGFK